jgi:histone-lysine N-methyltransferase SETMAR
MAVISEVSFRKVCAKWVPKMLTVEQKVARENMCAEHLQHTDKDGAVFLSRIITDDETWIHPYDPVTEIL